MLEWFTGVACHSIIFEIGSSDAHEVFMNVSTAEITKL